MILPFEDLRPGRIYLIQVHYQGMTEYHELEMRALYIGPHDSGFYQFTLRPLAGLLVIPKPWIVRLEEARNKPPFLPRKPVHA